MLVVGKGLGDDVTNGAAARPIVTAREERARRRESPREGKGLGSRGRSEPLAAELEARASLPPEARASRAEVDLSLNCFNFSKSTTTLGGSSIHDR